MQVLRGKKQVIISQNNYLSLLNKGKTKANNSEVSTYLMIVGK